MPGLVGLIPKKDRAERRVPLPGLIQLMMHESFYVSGAYSNRAVPLELGWTALAGGFSDEMPIWNETRDVAIVFSGEDHRDRRDLAGLRSRGHEFDQTNASYLVHLYEEQGTRFLEGLNGHFSGVVIDLRQKKVILFNDRYGLGRIYYHEADDGFYFASEAKCLLALNPEIRALDPVGLAEKLTLGCVLQNRTLFNGISQLPGGSAWEFEGGQCTKKASYFSPRAWEGQERLDPEGYFRELKETWRGVLPRYVSGPERIGISLTGGKDSRMIMAWLDMPPGALPCYTFGGTYRECADVRLARKIAQLCGQPHEVITVGDDFLSRFPRLAEETIFVTDGAMDVSGATELFVNRIARSIAPVRLTGNYGQEILRSEIAFKPEPLDNAIFDQDFARIVESAAGTYRDELGGKPLSFVAFKQMPWHHFSRLAVESSQVTMRSPFLDNAIVGLAYKVPAELAKDIGLQLRLISEGRYGLGGVETDRAVLERSIPFISAAKHLYQEFTFKAEYAFDYGMPQSLAQIDHFLRPFHLEKLFLGRHKFYHFRIWYRDRLAGYIKEILLDPMTLRRPHINGRRLEKIVCDHARGLRNHTEEIHRLLSYELMCRQLLENQRIRSTASAGLSSAGH